MSEHIYPKAVNPECFDCRSNVKGFCEALTDVHFTDKTCPFWANLMEGKIDKFTETDYKTVARFLVRALGGVKIDGNTISANVKGIGNKTTINLIKEMKEELK